MTWYSVRLKRDSSGKTTDVHEAQVGRTMAQYSIKNAKISMAQESVHRYRSNNAEQSVTNFAVLNCALLIIKFFKDGTERYAKEVVNLLHCKKFSIKAIQDKLKNITSCSEMVREWSGWILKNQGLEKKYVKIKEGMNAGEIFLYCKKVIELLKKHIEKRPGKEGMQFSNNGERKWFASDRYELLYQVGRQRLSTAVTNVCGSGILKQKLFWFSEVLRYVCTNSRWKICN